MSIWNWIVFRTIKNYYIHCNLLIDRAHEQLKQQLDHIKIMALGITNLLLDIFSTSNGSSFSVFCTVTDIAILIPQLLISPSDIS